MERRITTESLDMGFKADTDKYCPQGEIVPKKQNKSPFSDKPIVKKCSAMNIPKFLMIFFKQSWESIIYQSGW